MRLLLGSSAPWNFVDSKIWQGPLQSELGKMLAPTIQQMEKVARDAARTSNGYSSQVPF